ncbi:S-type anion channel SLAH3 [Glycine soja]
MYESSMENNINIEIAEQGSPEVPSLIRYISSSDVAGFDTADSQPPSPYAQGSEETSPRRQHDEPVVINHQRKYSISMPLSSEQVQLQPLDNKTDGIPISSSQSGTANSNHPQASKCYSQPMPKGYVPQEADNGVKIDNHPGIKAFKDKRFDSFKTWSGRLERQLTILRGKSPRATAQDGNNNSSSTDRPLPVDRYFDALEGPELETLRASEETVLPQDKQWPFLLRFPISSFGICLGVSSQAILWKALATSPSTQFLHISLKVNLILWFISIALVTTVFTIYLLKIILYFEAVRREYYHPIRVNFFFAPWIALLFLALGVPPSVTKDLLHVLWYILMTPILCLELKIYGQWMSGGQRRLSKVANPTNHLSIVGNFVGALLGASMGLKEGPIFFFAIGLAHYTVMFVTLYQRLPTNETLPKELHPVFFLFVAAPSVASMAWANIQGSFDYGSRIAYFIALFLYFSLAVRINFFRGFTFSLAWWAYTFPMTGAAIATVRYSNRVTNPVTKTLCVILSLISTLIVIALLVSTILHGFVFKNLFPNDLAIAISYRKRRPQKKWLGLRYRSHDSKEIENYLKFASEETVLPQDRKWPFLLRFPVSSFGICLGVGSQAILWKAIATSPSTKFLHISLKINLIFWFISVALTATVFTTYLLKIILYFEAVRREYYHPIRVNYFFAPWVSLLFLAHGVPPSVTKDLPNALWYILMTPILCLELKIYGQWMSGGTRRLSKVANPTNHLSVVGNFVGALLGASMGLKEGPIFFYAIGLAHYIVVFVTLYQRLPTNETLPKELHPVFFMFVAPPVVASMAWASIQDSFDYGSRISYFIGLFLYFSLAVRVNFFRGFTFSLAWWAYTFPMASTASATVRYANEVTNVVTKTLSVILSLMSTLIIAAVLVSTILHALVFKDLFPNDHAIAISHGKRRPEKKCLALGYTSHDSVEIDLEASTPLPNGREINSHSI